MAALGGFCSWVLLLEREISAGLWQISQKAIFMKTPRKGQFYLNRVSSVRSSNQADRRASISHLIPIFKGDPDPKDPIPPLIIKYPRI